MEFDAAISLFTERADKIDKGLHNLRRTLPVRKTVGATVIGTGAATTLLQIEQFPAVGRVWNLLQANLDLPGFEGPGVGTASSSGQVTNPGASSAITNIPPASLIGGALYNINWTVGLQGTVTAADGSNMRLNVGSVIINPIAQYPGVVGNYPMPPVQVVYPFNDPVGIRVRTIAAASGASAIYTAMLTVNTVNGNGITADIFVGPAFDEFAGFSPVVPDRLLLNQSLPSSTYFPRRSIWAHSEERVYALVYGLPANNQAVFSVRVAEYPLKSEEATEL